MKAKEVPTFMRKLIKLSQLSAEEKAKACEFIQNDCDGNCGYCVVNAHYRPILRIVV